MEETSALILILGLDKCRD